MIHNLVFSIEPVPFARMRTNGRIHFIPPKQRSFMRSIGLIALNQWKPKEALTSALSVDMTFSFKKAKTSKLKHHTKRGDLSNFIKLIEDALNNIVWKDDSQIIELQARKVFSEQPSISITIKEILT